MPKQMPTPDGQQTRTSNRTTNLPAPAGGSFNPFLKPVALGKKGKGVVKILGVRDAPPDSFSEIIIECSVNGKTYDWGMKFNSGNYRRLFEEFGSKPAKWKGSVNVGVKSYAGKDYVAME